MISSHPKQLMLHRHRQRTVTHILSAISSAGIDGTDSPCLANEYLLFLTSELEARAPLLETSAREAG